MKELIERLKQWGDSGWTKELYCGDIALTADCLEAADALERLVGRNLQLLRQNAALKGTTC